MIDCRRFLSQFHKQNLTFFAGVPDSLLKDFCACLTANGSNISCANEANAIALATGYHLASSNVGVCYMQNSGLGNAYNALASLTHPDVYSIPVLLLIGWRGEPGKTDEPQHLVQGRITLPTLDLLGIDHAIMSDDFDTASAQLIEAVAYMSRHQAPYALIVRPNIFEPFAGPDEKVDTDLLSRESALEAVVSLLPPEARTVATTGKLSRELAELRASGPNDADADFLTVGSMGQASSIALGVALHTPARPVFCLDGDGAALMHLGAWAAIGYQAPANFKHILFNNSVHDSVGGQATAGPEVDFLAVAKATGYRWTGRATSAEEIKTAIKSMLTEPGPCLLEIKIAKGAQADLGRPSTTPCENKQRFMSGLK